MPRTKAPPASTPVVRSVGKGKPKGKPPIHCRTKGSTSSAGLLSEREPQVLRLLGGGLSGPEIFGALFISCNTLRTHTKHIFAKLEAAYRWAAIRKVREPDLL